MTEEPPGGIVLSPAEIEALGARWSSCWTPSDVARHLAGIAIPWYVAAGWALDLFRGRQTREHGDIEVAIPAATFPMVRDRFPGYVFDGVGTGRIWEDATPDVLAATHQTWLRDPATSNYLVDVFREPHDGDTCNPCLSRAQGPARPVLPRAMRILGGALVPAQWPTGGAGLRH